MRYLVGLLLAGALQAETVAQAQTLIQKQDYAGAAKVLEAVVEREPQNAQAWFLLGYAHHGAGNLDEAIPAHEKAAGFAQTAPTAMYNLACAFALKKDPEQAFAWLQRAIQAGFKPTSQTRSDPDLASLRGDPRFDRMLPPFGKFPPGNARQFDFWIGDWATRNRHLLKNSTWADSGKLDVRIFSALDGKLILEYTDGSIGGSAVTRGFSARAFDPKTNEWQLVLLWPSANNPSFGTLRGGFRHGRGEFFSSNATSITRYSFSDISPTRFRWDSATSPDNGRTWSTTMIFLGTRLPKGAPALKTGPSRTNAHCSQPVFRGFDFLIGEWKGVRGDAAVTIRSYSIMEGSAVVDFTETADGFKSFAIRAYEPRNKAWVRYGLDNKNPVFERLQGTPAAMASKTARIAWAPDGNTLKQTRSRSTDGGKTWEKVWEQTLSRDK